MKSSHTLFAAALALFLSFSLTAQDRPSGARECGTQGKHPDLIRYQAGEIQPVGKSLETIYVPARMVLVGDNDGNGYLDPLQLLRSFELLNSDFADINIQLYLDEIDYLNRSNYYEHSSATTGQQMMIQNNKRDVVNSYIVEDPAGNCGYYFPGLADGIALGKNCMGSGDRTWSHELGHLLTLPHTFYGWESQETISSIDLNEPAPETVFYRGRNVPTELVDGSNCLEAADGFCDTKPDFLMQRWQCNGNVEYRDSLLDADSTRFAVSARNIMSYALDGCVEGFTPEQQMAMTTNLAVRGIGTTLAEEPAPADEELLALMLPEHNATLEVSDYVELVWNSVPRADYYVVQLNSSSNFNGTVLQSFFTTDTTAVITEGLTERVRYYWRVRPINRFNIDSDFGDDVFRFRNGDRLTSTIDAALDAGVRVVPNPVSGGRALSLTGTDLGSNGTLNVELISPAGRVLQQRNLRVNGGAFATQLDTADLPAGVYFVRLRLDDKLVTRRVMVTP